MADGVSAPIGCTSTCTFFAVRLADAYSGNCTASCFDWMPSADGLHRVHNGLSYSDSRKFCVACTAATAGRQVQTADTTLIARNGNLSRLEVKYGRSTRIAATLSLT